MLSRLAKASTLVQNISGTIKREILRKRKKGANMCVEREAKNCKKKRRE